MCPVLSVCSGVCGGVPWFNFTVFIMIMVRNYCIHSLQGYNELVAVYCGICTCNEFCLPNDVQSLHVLLHLIMETLKDDHG